jgi:BirA family biotin operon repressor/biotin-[acetyl-CoA-carboxylase] ligase
MLSETLGISRVAVWKHIKKLQACGYRIQPSAKGYQLHTSPDVPYPWEFPQWDAKLFYFPEVDSTMDVAKEMARKGCPHFSVVVAGRQKSGRGRLNRIWRSDAGGLYFTMVLRPQLSVTSSFRLGFAASLTMVCLLRDLYHIPAMLKWPNDILVEECKICGMLSELDAESDQVKFLNIGMGINVNNDPTVTEPGATSLKLVLGHKVSLKDLLGLYLDRFESRLKTRDSRTFIDEWKKYSITLQRYVRVVTPQKIEQGRAVDVDENGALVLQGEDGAFKKIMVGDCFHHTS